MIRERVGCREVVTFHNDHRIRAVLFLGGWQGWRCSRWQRDCVAGKERRMMEGPNQWGVTGVVLEGNGSSRGHTHGEGAGSGTAGHRGLFFRRLALVENR